MTETLLSELSSVRRRKEPRETRQEKKRQAGEGEQASAELSVSVTLETTQENRCDYSHRHIWNMWEFHFQK